MFAQTLSATKSAENLSAPGHQVRKNSGHQVTEKLKKSTSGKRN